MLYGCRIYSKKTQYMQLLNDTFSTRGMAVWVYGNVFVSISLYWSTCDFWSGYLLEWSSVNICYSTRDRVSTWRNSHNTWLMIWEYPLQQSRLCISHLRQTQRLVNSVYNFYVKLECIYSKAHLQLMASIALRHWGLCLPMVSHNLL